MSISGQQSIQIGNVNSPVNSDSLYDAFTKIEDNFGILFACSSPITTIVGGQGINVATTEDTAVVTNTGVLKIFAGENIQVSANTGVVTISATGGGNGGGNGSVTSVGIQSSTLNVLNSPITGSGNMQVNLPVIANVSGTYSTPVMTVDGFGRITQISNVVTGNGTVQDVTIYSSDNTISVSQSANSRQNPTFDLKNRGVTGISAGTGILVSGNTGNITISAVGSGNGSVTSVGVVSNSLSVSNSPVISSGNIVVELQPNTRIISQLLVGTPNLSNTTVNSYGITTGNGVFNSTVTAGSFSGDGHLISNISAANIVGVVEEANIANYSAYSGIAVSVSASAQPVITSVGDLVSLNVTNSVTVGANVTALNFFGNIIGNISGNIVAPGATSQLLYNNQGEVAATQVTTDGVGLTSSGNITAARFSGNGGGLFNIVGSNVIGQVPNALVSGTVYSPFQPFITSLGNLTSLTVTGNTNCTNIISTGDISVSYGNIEAFQGNITALNLFASGQLNAQVGNIQEFTSSNISASNSTSLNTLQVSGDFELNGSGNINSANITNLYTTSQNVGTATINSANVTTANIGTLNCNTAELSYVYSDTAQFLDTSISNSLTVAGVTSFTGNVVFDINAQINVESNLTVVGNGLFDSNVIVSGNLDVLGTINSTSANIIVTDDLYIELAGNAPNVQFIDGSGLLLGNANIIGNANVVDFTYSYAQNAMTLTHSLVLGSAAVYKGNGSGLNSINGANVTGTVPSSATVVTINGASGGTVTTAITAPAFYATSDEQLKTDIRSIDSALEKVRQLAGKVYVKDGQVEMGLIAQNARPIVPESVKELPDGYLGVNYDSLVALLIEAVKSLDLEVQSIKARL